MSRRAATSWLAKLWTKNSRVGFVFDGTRSIAGAATHGVRHQPFGGAARAPVRVDSCEPRLGVGLVVSRRSVEVPRALLSGLEPHDPVAVAPAVRPFLRPSVHSPDSGRAACVTDHPAKVARDSQ